MSWVRTRSTTLAMEGPSRMQSLRFAPAIFQPMGIPFFSVMINHFHPRLTRSVGFLPVPSPPAGRPQARIVTSIHTLSGIS
jgi:hypothetical protein